MSGLDEKTYNLSTRSVDDLRLDRTRWFVALNNLHVGFHGNLCCLPYLLIALSSHNIAGTLPIAQLQAVGADTRHQLQNQRQDDSRFPYPVHDYLLRLGLG